MINYLKLNSEKYPDKVAIFCEGERITFSQLYDRVIELSKTMDKEKGSVVYIENVREIETIVLMLAAVAANRTYRVINDFSEVGSEKELIIDTCEKAPLYQVSTSGTTGKKKLINKDGLLVERFMLEFAKEMNISDEDIILNQLEFTFDASAKDIYLMVITGATLCIGSREKLNFPASFIELVEKCKITVFQTTPFFIKNICKFDGFAKSVPSSLRVVMFVGDVMKSEYLNYWISKLSQTRFINLYGTSETIGNLMYHEVGKIVGSEYVPLTRTFGRYMPYINEESVLCFSGTEGEDVVTDDLAKRDNENIFIIGRADNVRKIRGYRVSLEEIEKDMESKLELEATLCEIVEDEVYAIFEKSKDDEKCDIKRIQADLRKCMPKYLQPIHIKQVNGMPVNANGKLNRKKIVEYF